MQSKRHTLAHTHGKASHNGYLFQKLFSKRTIVQNRAYLDNPYKIDAMYVCTIPHTECQCVVACSRTCSAHMLSDGHSGHQCAHELVHELI